MSPPRAPVALGPFDLLAPAAEGASAIVWRAVHRARRTPVAVKIIRPTPAVQTARTRRLFAHEVRAVARLDHPGIVRIHDFGTLPTTDDVRLPAGAPYLAMEWISGGTLTGLAGRLDWLSLRATLLALLDALAHAHARGVVHQDLKAANVLCGSRGPVLSDFGIAFSEEQPIALESGPRLLGTPDYMAPEQILMQRRLVGPWSDLYALGCLTFELVSGRPPFAGRSRFEVLQGHLDAPIPDLAVRGDIPSALAGWVRRLLDKAPERRYRFAAHAAAALRALPGPVPSSRTSSRPPLDRLPLPGTGRALFALRETALVGREGERVLLRGLLDTVVAERRMQVALLEGPSGSGKSRMATWLTRRAHFDGVADSMRMAADGEAADDPAATMLATHLRVSGLDGPALLDLLVERLGDEEVAWGIAAALQADGRFAIDDHVVALGGPREVFAAYARALGCLTVERPLIVVIDDAAEVGLGLVEHLLEHAPSLPVLVLVTVPRDRIPIRLAGRVEALGAHERTARLAIGALPPEALAASLRARLRLDEGLLRQLVERSAGSPVFAEEMVRHWLRTDALVERPSGLALRARANRSLPADLTAVWRARLADETAAFGEQGRQAARAAAIVGERVSRRLWRRVARLDSAVLDQVREGLLDARLAVAESGGGWRFAHPMLREVLLESARRGGEHHELHRRCAVALMEQNAEPAVVAEHHIAAGCPGEAVPLLFDAIRRLHRRRDHRGMQRQAIRLCRALDALRRPFDAPERIELRILWAEACQTEEDTRAAWRHVSRAARQAEARGDARLIGWARLTQAHLRVRERDAIDRWLRPAWSAAQRARDPELAWSAAHALTFVLIKRGRFDEAERALTALTAHLATRADDVRRGDVLRSRALIARGRGALDVAREQADRALALYVRSGSRLKQSHGHNLVGDLARYAGALDVAAEAYRKAVHFGELAGSYDAMTDELNLGLVLLELGRFGEARRRLTAVVQRAERVRFRVLVVYGHLCLLVCEARDGRWAAWDARWRAIGPVRAGKLVDVDACRVAEMAGRMAARAGERARAQGAWRLAADQYRRLGREGDAAIAQGQADALQTEETVVSNGGKKRK